MGLPKIPGEPNTPGGTAATEPEELGGGREEFAKPAIELAKLGLVVVVEPIRGGASTLGATGRVTGASVVDTAGDGKGKEFTASTFGGREALFPALGGVSSVPATVSPLKAFTSPGNAPCQPAHAKAPTISTAKPDKVICAT